MMEDLPANSDDAISASMKMVDEADIYVGLFAHRYGDVPTGHEKSYTEMEYDRAVEREIPRLIFLMGDAHPVLAADVEKGEGGAKLDVLRSRIRKDQVVNFFDSPDALLAHVLFGLRQEVDRIRAAQEERDGVSRNARSVATLHHIADIPAAPQPYVAHPYTLLQTKGLIGRRAELDEVTDWIGGSARFEGARVLSVVAIGGMGKSALTWHWFENVVAQEVRSLAGLLWWGFYESDAHFENFLTRALAYTTGRPREQVEMLPRHEREQELLAALDAAPFVLVLDGLERVLVAYSGMRAAYIQDEDIDDREIQRGRHPQRKSADPRVGMFLRKLAKSQASRTLISSRLHPADLETETGDPLPGCALIRLAGLGASDALELWRAHGARGSREVMLPVFDRFGRHPLLIQVLAGEVARFRKEPGDFDAWHLANRHFDPFSLPLVQVRTQVLEVALRGLTPAQSRTLHVLAAFRMPTSLEALEALLIRQDGDDSNSSSPYESLLALDSDLSELEDRGLLGWDRRANRYDLHPIVRGVTWARLGEQRKADIQTALQAHFEAMPAIDEDEIEAVEDLTPAIEIYAGLVSRGRLDDACDLFYERLGKATLFRLGAGRLRAELLERLFPDGIDSAPRLKEPSDQAWALASLAQAYLLIDKPGAAVPLFRRACDTGQEGQNTAVRLANLSDALYLVGKLCSAEAHAKQALATCRDNNDLFGEGASLLAIGNVVAARGNWRSAEAALRRSLTIFRKRSQRQAEGFVSAKLAQHALVFGKPAVAAPLANRAWKLASVARNQGDFIRAALLQGKAALSLRDEQTADERLHWALRRARSNQLVELELASLVALAEMYRRRKKTNRSRELLDDLWEIAERGPYPLLHADALNVLTHVERDSGSAAAAKEVARKAFRVAWCDGPPFAYQPGLEAARKHLTDWGEPEPQLAPFRFDEHEPIPEIEIDPEDEFHSSCAPEDSE